MSDVESTSVRVSWQAVENADRYTVTLSQTMGDDQLGLCREDSRTVSVDTSSLSVVVGQTDDDMLRAYTTYSITVVAESDVWKCSKSSDPIAVTTTQTSKLNALSGTELTLSTSKWCRCSSGSTQCQGHGCEFYCHLCPVGWPESLQSSQWSHSRVQSAVHSRVQWCGTEYRPDWRMECNRS